MISENRRRSPGWPEILAGLAAYALLLLCFALLLALLPANDPVLLGVVGSTAGGFVGAGAFLVAFGLRIRNLRAFGFTPVRPLWLIAAIALGLVGYGLNLVIQTTYMAWFGT